MTVIYGTNVASTSSLVSAAQMASTSGAAEVSVKTTYLGNNRYGEAYSQGTTTGNVFSAIPSTPTGNGWVFAPGIGSFDVGNWSATVGLSDSDLGPDPLGAITLRLFKWSGGSYTLIGSIVVTSPTIGVTRSDFTFANTAMPSMDFLGSDLLYIDVWYDAGAGNQINAAHPTIYLSSSATAGVTNDLQVTTANWRPSIIDPFTITMYGSVSLDATLATASDMATVTGGVETSRTSTASGTNTFQEVLSQGGTPASVTAIPATPTGNGWIYRPGAGSFAAGNWSASIALACTFNGALTGSVTVRFFTYSGGTYTSIGTIALTNPTMATTRTVLSFAATAMGALTIGATDGIYVDLWWHDTFSDVSGDNPIVYESTSSTAGVASDMQITTAIFTPLVAPTIKPRYITRGFLSTIIPDDVTQPLAYKERGIGGTIIYEIRTFIPRALGGTYIPETWRMMPRAFGARFVQSLDQFKDISTRFRLKSANQLKDISTRFVLGSGTQSIRDIASRFRLMSANQLKDVATRFRLKSADQLKDIVSRFRLKSANQLKDIQSRFRLMSANQLKDIVTRFRLKSADQLKDIASRFRLRSADQQKDVASRFRLMSANQLKDIVTRFRLKSADQLKDITTRFILATPGQRLKDITSRFRLKSADQLKDIVSRFRLKSADQLKDVQSRFRLMSANQLKDIVSRFRLMSANQVKDVASRFRLKSANQLKDIQSRFRVMSANQLKDISTRLRLKSANQLRDIASRFILHGVGTINNRDIATRFVLIVPSNATWITRDGRISWLTRDDKAAWDTRDDLAAWKTR